jgi:signal transduction histidine kinase
MLTYARIAHPSEAVAEDLDITEVVHDIVSLRGLPAGFVVACEAPMPIFRTQRTPIQVVLDNLIGNGLKHHDRSEGRITVTMGKAAGVAEFRVSDDGPGVPVQFHDRIFTLFQTLARRDDSEPGGIGLAIVKKKVEHHGGEIWVESNPPARGATFAFTWREAAP